MSAAQFLIAEPHPTLPAGSYTHSGRGGAGNTFRVPSTSTATTAATTTSSRPVKVQRSSRKFYSGIGGAGNAHTADERATLNFGEEFDRARARDAVERGHVGVGGAGNVYRRGSASTVSESPRSSHESVSSTSGFWGRLSTSSFRH